MPCPDEFNSTFREAIEVMPDGVILFDAERRFVACNTRYLEVYAPAGKDWTSGTPFETVACDIARECLDITDPRALDGCRSPPGSANGRCEEHEYEQKLKSGRWIRMSDVGLPNGWTVGIRTDITHTKGTEQAADALRASEARHRDFADSASDWFWEMDSELRFSYFSKRFTDITGVAQDALLGKTREETGIPDVDIAEWEEHLAALAAHRPFREFTHPRVRADGELIWLSINGRPIFGGGGEFLGFRGTGSNVTERVTARLELIEAKEASEQAARAKSEFLANMSHEIRTPMNGVLGMLELLQGSELSGQQQEFVDVAISCAGNLVTLLNDVLDLSKVEAGKLELESVDIDIAGLAQAICELHAGGAHKKGLEITAEVAPAVPRMVRGDPTRLQQVLSNLVSNAIKFTAHGEVAVKVDLEPRLEGSSASSTRLRFVVQDTGIGIAPEAQEQIFDSFTQADGTTTRRYGGTGLGLAISRHIVAHMRGDLAVCSNVGEGSAFYFTAEFELPPSASVELCPEPTFPGAQVLIVDDTETNTRVLGRRLAGWEMDSLSAASGQVGLGMMRDAARQGRPFDIALVDAVMPEMDGFEFAREVRRDPNIAGVPLVMLASLTMIGDEARASAAGVDRMITKPVRGKQLHSCLFELLHDATVPSQMKHQEPVPEVRATAATRHVLVVEDNGVNQLVALTMLRRLGYQAEAVGDGQQALKALRSRAFDLVLMDCHMPVLDGYAATQAIRESDSTFSNIPIVALTASAFRGDADRCFEAGMNGFLAKPMSIDALTKILETWLVDAGQSEVGQSEVGQSQLGAAD